MKVIDTFVTLLAGAAVVAASPVDSEAKVAKRGGGYMSGVCNGTSCKFGFSNWCVINPAPDLLFWENG
ncbi:hypothetical protein O9K51_04411 [Purpureocillium lavendulum]|uniref:Uncharacterized protein n=1 Tax=Purpureocillium lavendulum TaxID=1247861 RepID=A0AB34FV45_9HYPO|nr:hypothetical protein O9K51_04411 [Purpureocillium lavendulum]